MTRKRIRSTLVCANCRKKKTKCDRNLPCSTCVNAGIDLTCTYSSASYKRPQFETFQSPYPTNAPHNPKGLSSKSELISKDPFLNEKLENLKAKVNELEASIAAENPIGQSMLVSSDLNPKKSYKADYKADEQAFNESAHLIGINPIASKEDTISFLSSFKQPSRDKSKNVSYPYRPLQFIFLLKRDAGAKLFFDYQMSLKNFSWKDKSTMSKCSTNGDIESSQREAFKTNETSPLDQKSKAFYGSSFIKKIDQHCSHSDVIEIKNAISQFGINIGFTFSNSEIKENLKLVSKIKLVLPSQSVIFKLLKIFFERLYPFFPIIDEKFFMDDISRILDIDMEEPERLISMKIKKKHDISTLCILLIILRMSYLSIFSNMVNQNDSILNSTDDSTSSEEIRYLMKNPITLDVIPIAELCLREFDLTTNQDLEVLQAATFIKIYRAYAPEEGSGYTDNEPLVFNCMLIQMANSLYLNRDPDYFLHSEADERTKNLQRKLWYFLVGEDVEDSITFGTSIMTTGDNYDTRLPFYCQGNSNLVDVDFERQVVKSFEYLNPLLNRIHAILEVILKIKSSPKVCYLAKSMSELENLINLKLGQLKDYLVADASLPEFLKIMKLKVFLHCELFLSYTYYCLHVYYEEKGILNLHLFYLKKLIGIIFHDLADISSTLFHNHKDYFGPAFTLIMTPVLQVFFRMKIVIGLIMFIRLQSTLRTIIKNDQKLSNSKKKPNPMISSLKTLSELFRSLLDKGINMVSIFGSRYFYAWRSRKAYKYVMRLLLECSIYENSEQNTKKASLKFSLSELDTMIELLKSSMEEDTPKLTNYGINHVSVTEEDRIKLNESQLENLWCFLSYLKQGNNEIYDDGKINDHGTSFVNKDHPSESLMQDFDFLGGFSFNEHYSGDGQVFNLFETSSLY